MSCETLLHAPTSCAASLIWPCSRLAPRDTCLHDMAALKENFAALYTEANTLLPDATAYMASDYW